MNAEQESPPAVVHDFLRILDQQAAAVFGDEIQGHGHALGEAEGFNNKIRVTRRRAYGLRNQEYW